MNIQIAGGTLILGELLAIAPPSNRSLAHGWAALVVSREIPCPRNTGTQLMRLTDR